MHYFGHVYPCPVGGPCFQRVPALLMSKDLGFKARWDAVQDELRHGLISHNGACAALGLAPADYDRLQAEILEETDWVSLGDYSDLTCEEEKLRISYRIDCPSPETGWDVSTDRLKELFAELFHRQTLPSVMFYADAEERRALEDV